MKYRKPCIFFTLPASNSRLAAVFVASFLLAACRQSEAEIETAAGPDPQLPQPNPPALPILNITEAVGWAEGEQPEAASGFTVTEFATDLEHPRWLYVLPNGDVLVAETNAPERPELRGLIEAGIVNAVKNYIGSGVESPDRITLLRDADGDGRAETRETFLEGLHSPFGMVWLDEWLYVAHTDALWRYPLPEESSRVEGEGEKIADLPAGEINYHWAKNVIPSPDDDDTLLVTVGSNSNIGERGMDNEVNRAAVLEVDIESGEVGIYASGLRNPNGLAVHPDSGDVWVTVNERDNLGSELPPDYMTSVEPGGFYGWPWTYYGDNPDPRVDIPPPENLDEVRKPDYSLGPHTAPLGLAFYSGSGFNERYLDGAFVALHGSYNSDTKHGYKVVFVPFEFGQPAGLPEDILTGFLNEESKARGRPVGIAQTANGDLLIADDIGNKVWHLSASSSD